MNYTTIRITEEQREILEKFKIFPEEKIERVVDRIILTSSLLPQRGQY